MLTDFANVLEVNVTEVLVYVFVLATNVGVIMVVVINLNDNVNVLLDYSNVAPDFRSEVLVNDNSIAVNEL